MSNYDKLMDSFLKDKNDKLMTKYTLRYFYKIFRLLLIAVVITYFTAGFWFLICNEVIRKKYPDRNFIDYYDLSYEKSKKTSFEKYLKITKLKLDYL